jgi:hypothetical protein
MAAFNAASEKNCRLRRLGDDEARRHLHRDLNLRFVPRPIRPRRHNGGVVMGRHLSIAAVDGRLLKTSFGDAERRLSDTTMAGTPLKKAKLRVCEPIQSDRPCVQVASA